jgi:hypothetical protein
MTEKKKAEPKKKRAGKYDNKLKVEASFMDIIKASVEHANSKTPKPKK